MLIGLTGGIGSGKSTVSLLFSELGWQTMDADKICHDLYKDSSCEAYAQMVKRWGQEIVSDDDCSIDRNMVAALVFKHSDDRKWLNSILHPMVLDRAIKMYSQFDAKIPVVFDVPLLFEVNWEKYFTKIIAVFATKEIQKQRLLDRGMANDEIDRRIASQMSMEEKLEKADFALVNNGSLELLRKQCQKVKEMIFDSIKL